MRLCRQCLSPRQLPAAFETAQDGVPLAHAGDNERLDHCVISFSSGLYRSFERRQLAEAAGSLSSRFSNDGHVWPSSPAEPRRRAPICYAPFVPDRPSAPGNNLQKLASLRPRKTIMSITHIAEGPKSRSDEVQKVRRGQGPLASAGQCRAKISSHVASTNTRHALMAFAGD